MSDAGGIKWGKIIMGAAVVTAATAACIYLGKDLGGAIGTTAGYIGGAIVRTGESISGVGEWIGDRIKDVATHGGPNKAVALVTAALTGGAAMAAATSFVDRLNRSAEMVGIDTGRGR